jgi:subtilisin
MKIFWTICLSSMLCLIAINNDSITINAQNSFDNVAFDFRKSEAFSKSIKAANKSGSAMVIVGLDVSFVPDGSLTKFEASRQHLAIRESQNTFLQNNQRFGLKNIKKFEYIPYLAFEADAKALVELQKDASILSVQEDELAEPALAESTQIVGGNSAWASGFTGSGQVVAILDSGVDKNHSFLSGKVVAEACYSSNIVGSSSTSVCPGGVTESTESDSGLHCATSIDGCAHGTNVAGIAAGRGTAMSGVAKDANIIAIQIFSRIGSTASCSVAPCARYWTSDLIKGLERVRTLSNTMNNIAAVNLSLQTGQQFASNCDASHSATKAAIDNLRSVNIATIICSGNYSFTSALTAPACISTAISVGSVDDGSLGTTQGVVSNFSDSSPLLHLLAPGRWINSSIPGNLFQNYSGTSMAAPHVVGAFAILRQKKPNATIDQIQGALVSTGQGITDSRNGIVKPLIKIDKALIAISQPKYVDFDGDGKTDISVFRPSVGEWYFQRSSNSAVNGAQFGSPSDKPIPADYTGDGKTDLAFFRPSSGEWFILRSEDSSFFAFPFGAVGDIPSPGDFDGDGKADQAVFRPSNGVWYINRSTGGVTIQPFGTNGDRTVVADYDGDGKSDIAIFRPSVGEWYYLRSSDSQVRGAQFGAGTDKTVQGDYTGDGKADFAFFRPSTGSWFVLRSEDSSFFASPFGVATDIPTIGDYDGDGKFDQAVFRPSNGVWYINRSTAGVQIQQFGTGTDLPVPSYYLP